ncbi:MAG: SprT-like domain-containing protein [Candidatus Thiodiazotropha endolucinida]|nr:SprT-like domain-containing protein [Candidatus Thiodiazotropha taylori]MCW4268089.1 SprT-like domain-containing protein [Candidatus Thiodiazotropha endolucinida]
MKPTLELYQLLQKVYDCFNEELFDSKLPDVVITLQRERNTMGYFSRDRWLQNKHRETVHEIAINPAYFASVPLIEILQTIAHEMCHLYQHEHGKPSRGRYHNAQFAAIMEDIGLMPSTTGRPGGARTGQKMADYPIEGGQFAGVCLGLYEQGFFLPWIDRHSATKRKPSEHTALTEYSDEEGSRQEGIEEPIPQIETYQTAGLEALYVDMVAPEAQSMIVSAPDREKQAKQKSKTRYSCDCGFNVWGKAGLSVRCNVCETDFVASLDTESPGSN